MLVQCCLDRGPVTALHAPPQAAEQGSHAHGLHPQLPQDPRNLLLGRGLDQTRQRHEHEGPVPAHRITQPQQVPGVGEHVPQHLAASCHHQSRPRPGRPCGRPGRVGQGLPVQGLLAARGDLLSARPQDLQLSGVMPDSCRFSALWELGCGGFAVWCGWVGVGR